MLTKAAFFKIIKYSKNSNIVEYYYTYNCFLFHIF